MPHHNLWQAPAHIARAACARRCAHTPADAARAFTWQIFCSGDVVPCCTDARSFLRPGRRQCVSGRDLHAHLLGHATSLLEHYANRSVARFGLLNLMTAHEHFMHRLAGLDDDLAAWLDGVKSHLAADTALFLMSDHGTHGIWYNDFAIGQAEHRTPILSLILPPKFVAENPSVDAALRRNQRRRVTAYDLHATLLHVARWPAMPTPAVEATSLFVDLPDARSCEAAKVPAEYCIESACHSATSANISAK